MVPVKTVMITGASGFIGRATVAEARARGLAVRAVVRSSEVPEWSNDSGIEVIRADLSDPTQAMKLTHAMDVDALVHAGSSMSGSPVTQEADTIHATRTLLDAMRIAPVRPSRVVVISSLAVYDTLCVPMGGVVTETTPMEEIGSARDPYVRGKLAQEALFVEAAGKDGFQLWVMRPGVVYGPGRVWNAHIGFGSGNWLFRVGTTGQVPVCHVDLCAEALVTAAQTQTADISSLNVIDEDLPDRNRFIETLRASGWSKRVVPVPWQVLMPVARALEPMGKRVPGLLRPAVLKARMSPLRYDGSALRSRLGVRQTKPFEALMQSAIQPGQHP
ncbi:MAG: NAD(P)-dependent oxidoreductase [Rhodobacteraceae bacterium]|nr:NAD(P)-dependent oxidoreductase [Paracoccaceae bacterium]